MCCHGHSPTAEVELKTHLLPTLRMEGKLDLVTDFHGLEYERGKQIYMKKPEDELHPSVPWVSPTPALTGCGEKGAVPLCGVLTKNSHPQSSETNVRNTQIGRYSTGHWPVLRLSVMENKERLKTEGDTMTKCSVDILDCILEQKAHYGKTGEI